ncbi:transcriptional regulator [Erythrobacter westpacificensis]|uniref:Transcriptional regulator n=1 Tax=Erythrobacter westpacificensis TaxID=1055231 RepID=A0ABP9JV42_9SPHN
MTLGNEIIHQQHRLRIMAALDGDPEPLDFATLKSISGATDGNLGAHLQTLEKAGYISLEKEAVGRRNRTWASLTPEGKRAFRDHVAFLEDILNFNTASGSSKP